MASKPLVPQNFILTAALFEGAVAVLAIGLGWALDQPPLATFHWDLRLLALTPVLTLPLAAVMLGCMAAPWKLFTDVVELVRNVLAPLFEDARLLDLAVVALLAGVGEEMLFRGVLQAACEQWLTGAQNADAPTLWLGISATQWTAIAVVGVLFGLVHWVTPGYALVAALIGAYLGILWSATGNLLAPIAVHAIYDFAALVYFVKLQPSGGSQPKDRENVGEK